MAADTDALKRRWHDGRVALQHVYGQEGEAVAARARAIALQAAAHRPDALKALDAHRLADPDWFLQPTMVGYVCYVDRFASSIAAVADRLDYLADLGVTYLHLMPLLRSRNGENDGGYAVASYDEVDQRLGTMNDLEDLAAALRARGMSLCIDLVLNHTADDHEWAIKAAGGDPHYREYYRFFPDRELPDQYEQTLREVFPDFKPGNFIQVGDHWVWATFNEYQWDLNYENPDVFCAILETMCRLANRGIDIFRLDAVAFLWKRLGTDCENQPEAHQLLTALRAFVGMAAPATVFKAEAIVSPNELVPYLGYGHPPRRECELAYNNQLMVMLWSSLATRDGFLMTKALSRMVDHPAGTSWVTYVRCHDDIGWAVDDGDAASVGWDGFSHRAFLSSFFAGEFPGSFGRGTRFQVNEATGDSRISGTAASLCGIDAALEADDEAAAEAGLRRLELAYAFAFSYGGIPLIYMGDELAVRNDFAYLANPDHAADNRWMHRPVMDWSVAARRSDPDTIEQRAFVKMRDLAKARGAERVLHGSSRTRVCYLTDRRVCAFVREASDGRRFVMVGNFSDDHLSVARTDLPAIDRVSHSAVGASLTSNSVVLPPLSYVWMVGGPS
jgi:amylosucrase